VSAAKRKPWSGPRPRIALRPSTRKEVNKLILRWHRHHKPVVGLRYACVAEVDGEDLGAVVVGDPRARAFGPRVAEVTRLACRGKDINVGSCLLGAAWRAWRAMGGDRMVSYVRFDETGHVYHVAGWIDVAEVPARDWLEERRLVLPGILEPATEVVDRVRWEIAVDMVSLRAKQRHREVAS
jgi:hypothetical protein